MASAEVMMTPPRASGGPVCEELDQLPLPSAADALPLPHAAPVSIDTGAAPTRSSMRDVCPSLAWLQAFAARHSTCPVSGDTLLADPVLSLGSPAQIVSRPAAVAHGLPYVECPESITRMFAELRTLLIDPPAPCCRQQQGGSATHNTSGSIGDDAGNTSATLGPADPAGGASPSQLVGTRKVKIRKAVNPTVTQGSGGGTPSRDGPGSSHHMLHQDPNATQSPQRLPFADGPTVVTVNPTLHGHPQFQGVSLNTNVELPPSRKRALSEEHGASAPIVPLTVVHLHTQQQQARESVLFAEELLALAAREGERRNELLTTESVSFLEIQKQRTMQSKQLKAKRVTAKQLRCEGDQAYGQNKYQEACEAYSKALQHAADGTVNPILVYGNRSAALFMMMRFKDCIEDCERVLQQEPNNVRMYLRAIKAAVNGNDFASAVDFVARIEEAFDGAPIDANLKAEMEKVRDGAKLIDQLDVAAKTADTSSADEILRMLMMKFPEAASFRVRWAETLAGRGKLLEACDALEKLVGWARTPQVCWLIAKYYHYSGFEYFDRARKALEEPVKQGDQACVDLLHAVNRIDAGKQSGNSLFSSRQFEKSIVEYTKAIDVDPLNGRVMRVLYCNRAAAYKETQRYRDGVDDCAKAIALDPNFSKAYARRARCYHLLADFDMAIKDFRRAIELDKQDQELPHELRASEVALAKEAEKEKNYYYVLGLNSNATTEEIKKRFKEMSLKYHPDRCVHLSDDEKRRAEHKFKLINSAHETLSDDAKRRVYDVQAHTSLRSSTGAYAAYAAAASAFPSSFGQRSAAGGGSGGASAAGTAGSGTYGSYGSFASMRAGGWGKEKPMW